MTRGTTLPPQAYTREMLTQAYQWVHTQPESIKKLAISADALVGLYLRARRNGLGESSLESAAPVSTEDFRQSLKSLREEIQQFDNEPSTTAAAIPPSQIIQSQITQTPVQQPVATPVYVPPTQAAVHALPTAPAPTSTSVSFSLDSKTHAHLKAVKERFNLSSEQEALRFLVSLGVEKLNQI